MNIVKLNEKFGDIILYKSNYNIDIFDFVFYLFIFIRIIFFEFIFKNLFYFILNNLYLLVFIFLYLFIKKKIILQEKLILIKDYGIIIQKKYLNKTIISENILLKDIKDCIIIEHIGGIRVKNLIMIEKFDKTLKNLTKFNLSWKDLIKLRRLIKKFYTFNNKN